MSSPSPRDPGLTLVGRIEDASVADLLRSLGSSRDTGLLVCSREGAKKTVWLQEGRIIFASSTEPDDRLGECMLRDGIITVEQYEESGRLIRPGKRQGTILVELGYVTPAELVRGVRCQVEQIVFDLLRWRTGESRIELGEFDTRDIVTLNISTENIVFAGVKRGSGWSQILRGLGGSLETVLAKASDADTRIYKLDLSDDESHVFGLANGRLNVAQICAMSYLSNYETCLTLHALSSAGILRAVTSRDAETAFRDQIAESEQAEIKTLLSSYNGALGPALGRLHARASDVLAAIVERAIAGVLDEHYDVFREVDLLQGRVREDLVMENLSAVDPGRRRALVERALAALTLSLADAARTHAGAEAEAELTARLSAVLATPAQEQRRNA